MVSGGLSQPLLGLSGVSKSFGNQCILADVSLTIHEGDRVGIIGRNGCGKSTLLKIFVGAEPADEGRVTRRQGTRVALLSQDTPGESHGTVGGVFAEAVADLHALLDEHHALADRLARGTSNARLEAEYERVQHVLRVREGWSTDAEIKRVMVALNVPSPERHLTTLSGGELRRLQLAATLLRRPDILLLDEPTNHIDADSARWIEDFLAGYPGSCVLVTHDRYFLDRVVSRIIEVDQGSLLAIDGNYEAFLERKARLEEHAARTDANRQAAIRRELAWLQRGPKARSTKQKARIKRFEELEGMDIPRPEEMLSFEILSPNRLGKRILEAEKLSLSLGESVLFRDFSLIMQKGMRVGVLGPNGCGKTSLLRVLMGQLEADSGKVYIGDSTEFLYVDQKHEAVNPTSTVLQFLSNGMRDIEINGRRIHIPAYLERFLFDRSVMNMELQYLSGGERSRLDLAKKLMAGGNVLVLDEPTNDLDLSALRVLEEMVFAFQGCALIVSHDRYFLNRICTHVAAFGEDARIVTIAGNYDDYLRYCNGVVAEKAIEKRSGGTEARPLQRAERARRLTWREKRELEHMEDAILTAEGQVARLQQEMNAPDFYKQPHAEVQRVLSELESAGAMVHELYARWSELERIADGTLPG